MNQICDLVHLTQSYSHRAGTAEARKLGRLVKKCLEVDQELTLRVLLWGYDCRGGAGNRDLMKTLLPRLVYGKEFAARLVAAIPVLGRWDMVFSLLSIDNLPVSIVHQIGALIKRGLKDKDTHDLVCKWLPRKGCAANRIRGILKMSPKQYRQMLAASPTVESLMSANKWADIEYDQLPVRALAKYKAAFMRHDQERFCAFQKDHPMQELGHRTVNEVSSLGEVRALTASPRYNIKNY